MLRLRRFLLLQFVMRSCQLQVPSSNISVFGGNLHCQISGLFCCLRLSFKFFRCSEQIFTHARIGLPQKCLDALRIFSLASESGKRTASRVFACHRLFRWLIFRPSWKKEDRKCSASSGHFYISWLHEAVTCNAPLWQLHFGSVSIFADRCRPRGPHFAAWNQKRSCFSGGPMQLARRSAIVSFRPKWFLRAETVFGGHFWQWQLCRISFQAHVMLHSDLSRCSLNHCSSSDWEDALKPFSGLVSRQKLPLTSKMSRCFCFNTLRKVVTCKAFLWMWWVLQTDSPIGRSQAFPTLLASKYFKIRNCFHHRFNGLKRGLPRKPLERKSLLQLLYSLQVLPEINLTKIASKVFGRPPYSFHDWFQQRWKEDCLESLSTGRAGMDKGEDVPCCSAFCHLSCNFTKSQLQGAFPTVVLWLHLLPALASKSSGFYGWSFGRMGMKKGKYFENRAFGHEMRRLSFKFKDSHFVKFSVGRRLCDGYFAISSWIGRGSFQVFKVSQGLQVSRQRVLIYDLLASLRAGSFPHRRAQRLKKYLCWCC